MVWSERHTLLDLASFLLSCCPRLALLPSWRGAVAMVPKLLTDHQYEDTAAPAAAAPPGPMMIGWRIASRIFKFQGWHRTGSTVTESPRRRAPADTAD